ncbi:MAG: hypothetical protein BWZ08_01048 [candidate division BRC1 bacterium ADurb.BinA292]|nr:MAG: hypothetical protein BWZ08_01048 [candidate division BRC1 bacterium ADurb.BinA292]
MANGQAEDFTLHRDGPRDFSVRPFHQQAVFGPWAVRPEPVTREVLEKNHLAWRIFSLPAGVAILIFEPERRHYNHVCPDLEAVFLQLVDMREQALVNILAIGRLARFQTKPLFRAHDLGNALAIGILVIDTFPILLVIARVARPGIEQLAGFLKFLDMPEGKPSIPAKCPRPATASTIPPPACDLPAQCPLPHSVNLKHLARPARVIGRINQRNQVIKQPGVEDLIHTPAAFRGGPLIVAP